MGILLGIFLFLGLLALCSIVLILYDKVTSPERDQAPPTYYKPAPKPAPKRVTKYTQDWAQVSRAKKELYRWKCEDCGVYLGEASDRSLLHVHHQDLNPQNNSFLNLEVLCVICHSERPGVGHRRLAGAITNDGRRRRVELLRLRS
jgi:hypothetical protein